MESLHNARDFFYTSVLTVAAENKHGSLPLLILIVIVVAVCILFSLQAKLGKKCWKILRKWMGSYNRKAKEEDRMEYCLNMDNFSTSDPVYQQPLSKNVDLQLRNLRKEVESLKEAVRFLKEILENRNQGFGKSQTFDDGFGYLSDGVAIATHRNGWPGFHCASEQ